MQVIRYHPGCWVLVLGCSVSAGLGWAGQGLGMQMSHTQGMWGEAPLHCSTAPLLQCHVSRMSATDGPLPCTL